MLTGGCYCGAIRYRVAGPVSDATICHCEICRRTSGAPCVAWFSVPADGFLLLFGTPTPFRSSTHAIRTFCARCGTQLTFADDAEPGVVDVTTCSLDEPGKVAPEDHTFTDSKVPWLVLADGIAQFRRSRAEG